MIDPRQMQQPDRWRRAAQRAVASDLPGRLVRRGNAVLVPSRSQDGRHYHVRLAGGRVAGCDCEASYYGQVCTHRAAVAIRLYERETHTRVLRVKPGATGLIEHYLWEGERA